MNDQYKYFLHDTLHTMGDYRFYDLQGKFKCFIQKENHYIFPVPIVGYGRAQTDVDVLTGKDGCMLTVLQNIETGEVTKENPENWDMYNNDRFCELYGPIVPAYDSYRFNIWLVNKVGKEKAKEYHEMVNQRK